jgi:hypothetical protein
MMFAYFGGPAILERFLSTFYASWQPDEPTTLSVYLRPGSWADSRVQALVAMHVLPLCEATYALWVEGHLQIMEADAAKDRDRRATLMEQQRQRVIRCGRQWLAGKPLPVIGQKPRIERGTKLDETTVDDAAPRRDEDDELGRLKEVG